MTTQETYFSVVDIHFGKHYVMFIKGNKLNKFNVL